MKLIKAFISFSICIFSTQAQNNYEQAYGYSYQDQGVFHKMDELNKNVLVGSFNGHALMSQVNAIGESIKWKSFKGIIPGNNSVFMDVYFDVLSNRYTVAGMCTDCATGRKGQAAFLMVVDTGFNSIPINAKNIYYFFPIIDSFQVRENVELLRLGNLVYLSYSGDSGFGTDIYLHALNGTDFSQTWRKSYNTNFLETPVLLEFDRNLNIALGIHGWGKSRILKLSEKDGSLIKQLDLTDIPAKYSSLGNGNYALSYISNDTLKVSAIDTAGKEFYSSFVKLNISFLTVDRFAIDASSASNTIAVVAPYQDVAALPYYQVTDRIHVFNIRLQNSKPVIIPIPENGTIGRSVRQLDYSTENSFSIIGIRPETGQSGRPFYFHREIASIKPKLPTSGYATAYCNDSTLIEKVNSKTYPANLPLIENNVVYATKSNFQGKATPLWLDIYRPFDHYALNSNDKRPAIIYIHGGGYVFGGEDAASSVLLRAAERGMIGIGVKYRIGYLPPFHIDSLPSLILNGTQNTYRALQDLRDAVKWIYDRADQYNIDKSKIFIAGHSAGGNAVLNYAYMEEKDFPNTIVNSLGKLTTKTPIAGFISVAAPFSLMSDNVKTPLDYIQANENEPLYLIHGTCDSTAFYNSGSLFDPNTKSTLGSYPIACRKQSLNHPYHFTTVKGGGHDLGSVESFVFQSVFSWLKKEVSCGKIINTCESFTAVANGACVNVPTCPTCTSTPIQTQTKDYLNIYPNPFLNKTTIEFISKTANKNAQILIYNMQGKQLITKKINTSALIQLDLSQLTNGTYIIQINAEGLPPFIEKLIKV